MVKQLLHSTAIWVLCLGAAGCGGGGSPTPTPVPAPPPPPANQAPAFTSATTVTVAENSTATAYTASATDPEGQSVTYSITGGADADLFAITPAGALTFRYVPDFESPIDSDANNSYQVQIGASDGQATTNQLVTINVSDSPPPQGFGSDRFTTGLVDPTDMFVLPGVRVYSYWVTERRGTIWESYNKTRPIDVSSEVATDGDRGLLSVAIGGFGGIDENLCFAMVLKTSGALQVRCSGFLPNALFGGGSLAQTPVVAITIPFPGNTRIGGIIRFGPDHYLYIATGDGGHPANAQDPNSLLGKVLRIRINHVAPNSTIAAPGYTVAPDNPYASAVGGRPEIFAMGIGNPTSIGDGFGGLLFGDSGAAREEISLLRPQDVGANLGWPMMDGAAGTSPPANYLPPILDYAHGTGPKEGGRVVAGHVGTGSTREPLVNVLFFADSVTGALWTVPAAWIQQGVTLSSRFFQRRNQVYVPKSGTINAPRAVTGNTVQDGVAYLDFDGEIFEVSGHIAP